MYCNAYRLLGQDFQLEKMLRKIFAIKDYETICFVQCTIYMMAIKHNFFLITGSEWDSNGSKEVYRLQCKKEGRKVYNM